MFNSFQSEWRFSSLQKILQGCSKFHTILLYASASALDSDAKRVRAENKIKYLFFHKPPPKIFHPRLPHRKYHKMFHHEPFSRNPQNTAYNREKNPPQQQCPVEATREVSYSHKFNENKRGEAGGEKGAFLAFFSPCSLCVGILDLPHKFYMCSHFLLLCPL